MLRRYPFLFIALGMVGGVLLDNGIRFRAFPFFWIAGLSALCMVGACLAARRWAVVRLVCLAGLVCLTASLYAHQRRTFPPGHIFFHYRRFIGAPVRVTGVVVSDVRARANTRGPKISFELAVQGVDADAVPGEQGGAVRQQYSGRVLVNIYRTADLRYGDRIAVEGKLHRPYDFASSRAFSYRRFLMRRGVPLILSVKKDAPLTVLASGQGRWWWTLARSARAALSAVLARYLERDDQSVMQAFLLGERNGLSRETRQAFARTGTAHVLAVSGLHVGVVVGVLLWLLRWVTHRKPCQYLLAMLFLTVFVLLTGARPSVIRAAIMAGIFLSGFIAERESTSLNSLGLAAGVILLIQPQAVFDIGFQLSFLSVLAILTFFPLLTQPWMDHPWYRRHRLWRAAVNSVAVSVAAWLGVAGVVAYYFALVTPVTIVANLVVVPLVAVLVPLGLALLASAPLGWLAVTLAGMIHGVLAVLFGVIRIADQIPGGSFAISGLSRWQVGVYYLVLLVLFGVVWRWAKGPRGG